MRAFWMSLFLAAPLTSWAVEDTPETGTEDTGTEETDETDSSTESKDDSEKKKVIAPPVKKPVEKPVVEKEEEDGVIGLADGEAELDESVFDKLTEVNEKFGLILRPQMGVTTLSGNGETYSGYHAGLHVGYHKYYKLKLANIGGYTRTRAMFLPTLGEVSGSEMRLGSFVGFKLTALEVETGLDVLRHNMSVRDQTLVFDQDVGLAIPVKALVVFDSLKIKAGVEPRVYLGNNREAIDWEEQSFDTPMSNWIDEFSWNVGARIGAVGLSYDQLHMNGGIQRVISLGLQR